MSSVLRSAAMALRIEVNPVLLEITPLTDVRILEDLHLLPFPFSGRMVLSLEMLV